MRWNKQLYVGESIRLKKWVQYQIKYGNKKKNYYCITLPLEENALLDIYESRFLKTDTIDTGSLYVVGIASDKYEAFEVVKNIIEDVYIHTHGFDVASYLNIHL